MGHTRLGKLPKSKKWSAVVEIMTAEPSEYSNEIPFQSQAIAEIAKRTIEAAQGGLDRAINDSGLIFAFYLLTQVALASRKSNWEQKLIELGISLPANPTIYDLTTEMQLAIDDHLFQYARTTDVSEMAQKAVGDAIMQLAANKSRTLFENNSEDLRLAIRSLSTKAGFSSLGQTFFGNFTARFLNFYLSRVAASEINGNAFRQLGDITSFNDALRLHCDQSARIVHDFSGEWFSKTEFIQGINLENSAGFVAIALKKLKAELHQQEAEE